LGIVKDPAAIPWLTTKLGTPQERFVYGDWLSEWTRSRDREVIRYADGIYAHFTMKWMGDTDAWRKFLLELLDRAAARDSRWRCVRALSECFHDKPTMDFFAATERKCVGAELLWVDAYLIQHERDIDVGRLRKVIAELQQSPDGQQDLYWFARSGKHPAIVPWLISILGESDHDWVVPSLKMITFQYTLKSQEQWQGWFAENGERSRKEWIESSLATFEAVLSREPARAADILQHANWVEPSIAPRVENWLVHRDLHPILARWLLKCYHPYWRNALKRVAERIVNESWGDLDQFTQDGLKELDFVAESELSWEEGWDRSFP
jgi:hypothetical protein